jgi:hypothetical protein
MNALDIPFTMNKGVFYMPYLGNTLVFLDTSFFKNFKDKDSRYQQLFKYSKEGSIILCTSRLCLEEWHTQKIQNITGKLDALIQQLRSIVGENYFFKVVVEEKIYSSLRDSDELNDHSLKIVEELISSNKIKCYEKQEPHIKSTWEAYFNGNPPFKKRKNREDIPDAWIFEGAKDVLKEPEYKSLQNKFCISNDNAMKEALNILGFASIDLDELIADFKKEEEGIEVVELQETVKILSSVNGLEVLINSSSSLAALLSKSLNPTVREISLRLLGFIIPLDMPSHDSLIDAVVKKGYDKELTKACATILSHPSQPYIKNTGTHYIVGDKVICQEATDQLTHEIIEMLDEGENEH